MVRAPGILLLGILFAGCDSPPEYRRISSKWQEPRQSVIAVGLWGAAGIVRVNVPSRYSVTAVFDSAWKSSLSDWSVPKPDKIDWEDIGHWRMSPRLRTSHDGAAACSGRFYRFEFEMPTLDRDLKVLRRTTRKVSIDLDFPNEAVGGGGIPVRIRPPKGFSLEDLGLTSSETSIFMEHAIDNPFSTWASPKPDFGKKPNEFDFWRMTPRVLAEFVDLEVWDPKKGLARTVSYPTGWVIAAGHFIRHSE